MAAYMSRRQRPRIELRVQVLGFLILCGLAALIARLWWVQVAHGAAYTQKLAGRSEVRVRIPSVRGEIRDRNGIPLVQNRASYEVDFYLPEMVREFSKRAKEMGQQVPKLEYISTKKGMAIKMKEVDILKVVNSAVIPRLQELDLAKDYNGKRLQSHFHTDSQIPFTYIEDIDFPTIAKFSEHDVGLPGVDISIKPVRQYLYGALAAHLLGYVGKPQDVDSLPDARDYNFYQADIEGKSQVEQAMDQYLKGTPGVRVLQRNLKGVIDSELRVEPPKPGNNVYLTIDARIQMIAEQAMRAVGRGAAVVVDPNNGDILAMVSVPSYDPNTFIPSISTKDWTALNDNEADPLVNRAVSAFPPGSTFKIVTALAGLRKGIGHNNYTCTGSVTYGNRPFHCWIAEKGGSHGTIGLTEAIKVSCDCYFYQYGNAAGIDEIDDTAKMLGMGEKSGIELSDDAPGVIPGPDWMAEHLPREKWSQAQTANASIGQGYDLASPLQMAMAYATVANGGISYYPRLIHSVLTPDGKNLLDDEGKEVLPLAPKIRGDLRKDFTKQQIDMVRLGLWKVVNEPGGTGSVAKLKGITVAAKTGTAQNWRGKNKDTIAWFCCFAPYEKPRYSVAVMVNGGEHGGTVAGPIAARILDECVAMEQGTYTPELKPLAPAHKDNPFAMISAVNYKNNAPALGTGDDEEAVDPNEEVHSHSQVKKSGAAPDIRPDADAGGKVPVAARPQPTPDRRSIFQKFFHPGRPAGTPVQQQAQPPNRLH
ncbi:MAG: penicillin-binding protein 2 [Chthoniobacteraceae bacterium]